MAPLLTLPWFRLETIYVPIFPGMEEPFLRIPIQPFGILVMIGVILGARVAERFARRNGIEPKVVNDMITHAVVWGFLGSMVLNIVFYEPEKLLDPAKLWAWPGLSSYGGFFSALVGVLHWRTKRGMPVLPLIDPIAFGLPLGWLFGRTGCFSVHDHPGIPTDFFLAVAPMKEGGLRDTLGSIGCVNVTAAPTVPIHDLGLYEIFWSIGCVATFFVLGRTNRRPGFYVSLLPILYAPIRFFLDFLRTTAQEGGDIRYFGLTPGQYASIATLVFGVWLFRRVHQGEPMAIPAGAVLGHAAADEGAGKATKKRKKR